MRRIAAAALLLAACGLHHDGWDGDSVRGPNYPADYVIAGCGCWTVGLRPPDGPNYECASGYVIAARCSDPQYAATCRGDAWMLVCG